MDGEAAAGLTVGMGLTTRFRVLELRHPKIVSPVTEYTVLEVGLTTAEELLIDPGFQV